MKNKEQPLLQDDENYQSNVQRAISQTFRSVAHLANLLPTGTVLAFQLLSPIFTNQGHCDGVSRAMTGALLAFCGASCLLLSFTDSFRDAKGNVCYGLATPKAIWVIDGAAGPPPEEAAAYKLKFIDFLHAFMSLCVFAAVALFDQNVVKCFYPIPSKQDEEILRSLPVGIGVISSMFFVVFPTTRHGIGSPVSSK
ncbi:protein DMP4-like [Wolffia australiana]